MLTMLPGGFPFHQFLFSKNCYWIQLTDVVSFNRNLFKNVMRKFIYIEHIVKHCSLGPAIRKSFPAMEFLNLVPYAKSVLLTIQSDL